MTDLLATLPELEHLGVGFVSLTEALDLTTPAGLAHARENGKRLGRPLTAALQSHKVRKLRRSGLSKSEIARQLNIGRPSVRRILDKRTQA